jgi:hypothetical protein
MTLNRLFLRGIAVGCSLCLTGSLAFGATTASRTWVSGAFGDDANPCTRTSPCKTFAAALTATTAEGEIDVLDPGGDTTTTPGDGGGFGAVTIDKSVSIVAVGVVGAILVNSSNAITVSAGSTDVVVLRGLTLDGSSGGGVSGIQFNSGAALHIEDCAINSFGTGIQIKPGAASQIFIKNTVVRNSSTANGDGNAIEVVPTAGQTDIFIQDTIVGNNAGIGVSFAPSGSATVTASLDTVRMEKNSAGVVANDNAQVSVRNSVSVGNGSSGFVASSSSGPAVINVKSSMASGNAAGINSNGAKSTIDLSRVTVVDNATGLSATNGGHIVSFGNNKITNNGTNGAPTQTISQK